MTPSNRLLVGFGAGITLLVLVTIGLALTLGRQSAPLLPPDTPEGTVQRYLLALKEEDYALAESFLLITDSGKPPGFPPYRSPTSPPAWKANLGKTSVAGDHALVEVIVDVFHGLNGPFDNPVRTVNIVFSLERQPEGEWLISSPLDTYWLY